MSISHRPPGNAGIHWSRLAGRRLKLTSDAEITRQMHRGTLWFVVRDTIGDRYYRMSPSLYAFLALLDGRRTVEEAYQIVLGRMSDDPPTELDVMKLLWRLHAADLLRGDIVGRTEETVARADAMDRQKILMQLRSPLAIRIPILDPTPLLAGFGWISRILFSWPVFLSWITLVTFALLEVAIHWNELTGNFTDRVLSFDNLVVMWFVFPCVKLIHELGHALALKRWGCQTHEFGIMFLVFMPVPYVDASSSAVMTTPAQRAAVGAAGLYFELTLAALATFLWVGLEPGLARAVAFNVMIVAGASAVLFNGNPLLKFDAYYVLSDVLEMPNLAQRSSRWWLNLIQKSVLGVQDLESPVEAEGETPWLILYAPASLIYRIFLIATIALFVAQQFFYLGTILALVALFNVILWPLIKGIVFLVRNPKLKSRRAAAFARTTGILAALALLLFVVPMPHRTIVEGVVWYEEGSELRTNTSGAVLEFTSQSGQWVQKDEVIAQLADPETDAEILGLSARLRALRAQLRRELVENRESAALTSEEIAYVARRLENAEERVSRLTFRSPHAGQLVLPMQRDMDQGWLGRGTLLGHVVGAGDKTVIAALRQSEVELVANRLDDVEVRFSADLSRAFPASLERMTPQATDLLPSPLLASQGGGPFSVRQNAPGENGLHTIETIFLLEVSVGGADAAVFGSRAHVLFDFGSAPIASQAARALRQMFLREFEI